MSHFFNRGLQGSYLRQSNPDFQSDEDLLSNVDRLSRLLPTNDHLEDSHLHNEHL
jgi:hypothetical protein